MAYIETRKRKNGVAYVVEFRRGGRSYKLSLDKSYNIKDARFIAAAIDSAIASEKKGASLDAQTRRIFENLPPDMRRRLERVGLLAIAETMTLGEAVDIFNREYLPNVNARTRDGYTKTLEAFAAFVGGDDVQVDAISDAEARRFVEALASVYAKNTVALRTARVKAFFRFLVDRRFVGESPFSNVSATLQSTGRRRFVDRETIEKIAATLDDERRALLYTYRYAGLRRSEPYYLTCEDVDLDRRRLTVRSPKTARFAGRGERVAPIVDELANALAPVVAGRPGDALVFSKKLLPAPLQKFLPPGTRPFQDLRVSCENEWLEKRIPAHVVAAWLGHHVNVQAKHYAVVLDTYFEETTGKR